MRSSVVGVRVGIILFGLFLCAGSVKAGGPIVFNEEDGRLFPWLGNRAVYVVETGRLGAIPNEDAARKVAEAFQRWTAVPTADLRVENLVGILSPEALAPFQKDITVEDFTIESCTVPALGETPEQTFDTERFVCTAIRACVAQQLVNCPSPIIFDEDGSATAMVFGENNNTLGFSGPLFFSTEGDPVEPFRTLLAFTVLNGAFFDNDPDNSFGLDDPTGTLFLEALMVHEFGHFLGLSHSDVNGDTALLNPAVEQIGATQSRAGSALAPVDSLIAIGVNPVETMYPVLLADSNGNSPLNSLEKDDEVTLSSLYPCTPEAATAGRCQQVLSTTTGTITGSVFIPNGDQPLRAQGVLVIARRIDPVDNDGDGTPDDLVLKEAVSQFTGATFAPLRCTGALFRDDDGDGVADDINEDGISNMNDALLSGVFGACNTPTLIDEFQECANLLGGEGILFLGSCGFFTLGLSDPRPVGDPQENRFELTGLTPGTYIVQAVPAFIGGYSSPVRTSFPFAQPNIQSDDNVTFALFPNPQTGEFYNGLPTGCGNNATPCGNESASAADNPFAFTPIAVRAGERVDHVNIFLNTSGNATDIFANPGFNFCGLGDVNQDGKVDQADILAVVQAREDFNAGRPFNARADLNEDGSITFLDIDIITDIVAIPRPFDGITLPELKRGLAPFEAICTAARDGGCQIQAPVETLQVDGTPSPDLCTTARAIGCQVDGCL